MRFLILLSLLALLVMPAVAQPTVPLPNNIESFGPIQPLAATGSIVPDPIEINGVMRNADGLIVWCTAPFRYTATFHSVADTYDDNTITALADTSFVMGGAGGHGIEYPVQLILPGAISLTATITDTLWARPYYRK